MEEMPTPITPIDTESASPFFNQGPLTIDNHQSTLCVNEQRTSSNFELSKRLKIVTKGEDPLAKDKI